MPPIHILFADDDSDEFYLFNEALEHSGLNFILSRAIDGNDLIFVLKNKPVPDMVVIDINMPYKDGLEALTEIRSIEKLLNLPLIMYSTTQNAATIELSYQKGATFFVVKPHNFDGMVKVVKRIFVTQWEKGKKTSREQFLITGEE